MLTLGTQRDLTNDMLIKGIIDSVVTVNQFYAMLPFKGIQGNALAYNRESFTDQATLVGTIDTRDQAVNTINKDQQTFSRHSTELTTIIGDAQVNGLIQAVGSDYNDATAVQVAAKAKGLGRTYMNTLINGQINSITAVATGATVVNATYLALINANAAITYTAANLSASTGTVVVLGVPFAAPLTATATTLTANGAAANNLILRKAAVTNSRTRKTDENGAANFEGIENFVLDSENFLAPSTSVTADARLSYLDQIIDRVHDKDGMVDYLMMNSAGVRKITSAFRGVGTGFDMMDVKTSSGNVMSVQSYRGVPIFRNDFIGNTALTVGSDQAALRITALPGGDGGDSSFIYAGTIDDGSLSHGICGLTALKSAGMQVQRLGAMEDSDADITRVKWYCGLAHFSELGLVRGHMA